MRPIILASVAAPAAIALGLAGMAFLPVRGGAQGERPPWSSPTGWQAAQGAKPAPRAAEVRRYDVYRVPDGIDRGTCEIGPGEGGAGLAGLLSGQAPGLAADARDRACIGRSLEYAADRARVAWRNAAGLDYAVVPQRTFRSEAGAYCREFQTTAAGDGRRQTATGIACRRPGGEWQVLD